MLISPVKTDEHLRELVNYKDISFPLDVCTDNYGTFPDYTLNCHWHSTLEIGTVAEGCLDFYMAETCIKLHKGDCVFINSNVLHMARQSDPLENAVMLVASFPPSLFPEGNIFHKYFQPVMQMPLQGFGIKASNPHGTQIARFLKVICNLKNETYGYELECLGLLSRIWLEVLRYMSEEEHSFVTKEARHRHRDLMKQMISYIQEHFADNITIQDLTEHAHVSRSECFRSFRR